MTKKKVLILTFNPIHKIGGVEIYSDKLINIFLENNWEVTEFSMCYRGEIPKTPPSKYRLIYPQHRFNKANGIKFWPTMKKVMRDIDRYKTSNEYDLVINNYAHGFKWEHSLKNELLIQHQTPEFYEYTVSHVWSKFFSKSTYFFQT